VLHQKQGIAVARTHDITKNLFYSSRRNFCHKILVTPVYASRMRNVSLLT
jgi:hypothetical protein